MNGSSILEIKKLLLEAPDGQLDECVRPMIEKWGNRPTALQALELIDVCARGALASAFTMRLLNLVYSNCLDYEKSTHEEIVKLATWRS